jgi:predicted Zn-dependent peptidase
MTFFSTLLLLGFGFPASGQFNEIEFREFDLENGLHVILHRDNSTPIVAVNITYHVGSKNEQPDRTGFAHFFEHLMFEGSENIDRGTYFSYVQNAGGVNNAGTDFDMTMYYEILPSNQLELGLWLESERLLHLRIDSTGVETQREVVKEERLERLDNQPYGSFLEEAFAGSFKVHPYRWMPIGKTQYIDEATLGEFLEFYNHFYVPENAVLVIAGDIDYERTRRLVEDYFGGIPGGGHEIYRPDVREPPSTEEFRKTVYDNVQLPGVFLTYRMPGYGDPDTYALGMLQTLLAGGESSRLYKSLVDNQQLTVYTSAVPLTLEDAGLFVVYSFANVGVSPQDVETAMDGEIRKVVEEGLSDREFRKLVNRAENDFISRNTTMAGISENLAKYYTVYGDPGLINTEIDNYLNVTPKDIVRVAEKYLVPENRVVLYYLPKEQEQ